MSTLLIYAIGFTSQLLFSARTLIQWIMSERRRQVVSPSIFWILSLMGSVLLFCYGWLRNDFSIMLGQSLSYYIYIWNLNIKGVWKQLPALLRLAIILLPVVSVARLLLACPDLTTRLFLRDDLPLVLLLFGSLGQLIFTCRFIYQWHYSRRRQASILPAGFWIISLVGCTIIVIYGILRIDPVLIVGQMFGLVVYSRNLIIWKKQKS